MAPMSGTEMHAVSFKQGHPTVSDDLMQAVTNAPVASHAMKNDLDIINSLQGVRFDIIGTADDVECRVSRCEELSYRRARLVRNWLIENGAPANSLNEPIGQGSPFPPNFVPTEEERFMVRSVRIEIDTSKR